MPSPDLSSPRKRGPIAPAAGARGRGPYPDHVASPRRRTLDRLGGVDMGPRFRGDDKLGEGGSQDFHPKIELEIFLFCSISQLMARIGLPRLRAGPCGALHERDAECAAMMRSDESLRIFRRCRPQRRAAARIGDVRICSGFAEISSAPRGSAATGLPGFARGCTQKPTEATTAYASPSGGGGADARRHVYKCLRLLTLQPLPPSTCCAHGRRGAARARERGRSCDRPRSRT